MTRERKPCEIKGNIPDKGGSPWGKSQVVMSSRVSAPRCLEVGRKKLETKSGAKAASWEATNKRGGLDRVVAHHSAEDSGSRRHPAGVLAASPWGGMWV